MAKTSAKKNATKPGSRSTLILVEDKSNARHEKVCLFCFPNNAQMGRPSDREATKIDRLDIADATKTLNRPLNSDKFVFVGGTEGG